MTPGELRYRERCLDRLGFPFRGDEALLDVGCGDGGVARLLLRRVAEVIAVDVEPHSEWSDEPGLTFLVANGESLPFEARTFDVVHSKDSLHHMNRPEDAVREYDRVLRPGGHALVTESNRYNPSLYVNMTRMRGHEHFSRKRFRALVTAVFPNARFGSFEAHYVPGLNRLLSVQEVIEDALDRLPGFPHSYNYAVASA